jgi:GNAT superfamily N-acetyltransferase
MEGRSVVGHISLRRQAITIPAVPGQAATGINRQGQPLEELFVQTFAVDEAYRRRGYGRVLQISAVELARDAGCYQMRSWSSLDHEENYALKLSLGFAICPAVYVTESGASINGVYFVMRL